MGTDSVGDFDRLAKEMMSCRQYKLLRCRLGRYTQARSSSF